MNPCTRSFTRSVAVLTTVALTTITAHPVRAQWVVFDPANHVEAVMEVAAVVNNVRENINQVRNGVRQARRLYGDVTYYGENAFALLSGEMPWRDLEILLEGIDNEALASILSDLPGVDQELILYGLSVAAGEFEPAFDALYQPIQTDVLFGRPVSAPDSRLARAVNAELQRVRQIMAATVEAEAHVLDLATEVEGLRTEIERGESAQAIAEANARLNAYLLEEQMMVQKLLADQLYMTLDHRARQAQAVAEEARWFDAFLTQEYATNPFLQAAGKRR